MAATSTTADTHVGKRQYQPSIASYFKGGSGRSQSPRSPLSPPLDAATQASLLSVGMRVRKSVPEGYKTHKTLGMDSFPFPSTAPTASFAPPRPAYSSASSRELTPFCGLHKVGGLASQPQSYIPPSTAPATLSRATLDGDDGVPDLSASQQTLPSTQGSLVPFASVTSSTKKKRSFEEEIEDDMDAFFVNVDMTEPVAAGRRIARPKGSRQMVAMAGRTIAVSDGEDFEDADFLSLMDEAE
ncbi:hypothetical protein LTR53_014583 [Teratosphaeriaceae sp. CCFEE 6253]|nr:hypothetical protein LTR53_014583 [Teratosphaeriaceae sp. CCFEE 6253]